VTDTPVEVQPEVEPVPVDVQPEPEPEAHVCRHCGEAVEGSVASDDWLCPACDHMQDSMVCPTCKSVVRISAMPEELAPKARVRASRKKE
jgi:hypothetical protein